MKLADVVVGNSSSGIIEAPSLLTPTVNVGARQKGRMSAASVIHCNVTTKEIGKAITKALSLKSKKSFKTKR
jgi:UDP-N-acetylglucosamine 2-epimerase